METCLLSVVGWKLALSVWHAVASADAPVPSTSPNAARFAFAVRGKDLSESPQALSKRTTSLPLTVSTKCLRWERWLRRGRKSEASQTERAFQQKPPGVAESSYW